LGAELIHLVGHSLGGQSVGKMGRSFQSAHLGGQKVRRITGLDPAGPRFESNGYQDGLRDLEMNILTAESAGFVDVIHTNGGFTPSIIHAALHLEKPRLGYLQQLGHMDFYPDGGSFQDGCPPTFVTLLEMKGSCSHGRSSMYYVHSINEKRLFPSKPCESARDCNKKIVQTDQVSAYMGEDAEQYYRGGKQLFYLDVEDCNWTFKDHNNTDCSSARELTDGEKDLVQKWGEVRNQGVNVEESPKLHPIMKEFQVAVDNAHQSLVKQVFKSTDLTLCGIMKTTLAMVIQARQALDCGAAGAIFSSTDLLGNSGHEAIVEATRSCIGSDDLCLVKKLRNSVKTSSLGPVCSTLREVESGLQTARGIFCHQEELGTCLGCICIFGIICS